MADVAERGRAGAVKEGGHIAAPRGRPPLAYHIVCGEWRHLETGEPFDAHLHAAGVHARKQACMHWTYWARGGRERRLARYEKKRKSATRQITLPELRLAEQEQKVQP